MSNNVETETSTETETTIENEEITEEDYNSFVESVLSVEESKNNLKRIDSKFKVCLKVQDRSDSMEMLKKPDAASLKEAGRFYLQVGYDEYYDIGQSGYSGVKYIPSDTVVKKVDNNISYITIVIIRVQTCFVKIIPVYRAVNVGWGHDPTAMLR